jgi:hypothetical protein
MEELKTIKDLKKQMKGMTENELITIVQREYKMEELKTIKDLKKQLKGMTKNELITIVLKISQSLEMYIRISETLKEKIHKMEKKND